MPYFPAINLAFHSTIAYFQIGRIGEQIKKMAGGANLSYLDSYYDAVFEHHRLMEIDIDQHYHGSTDNMQNQYFEYLRTALEFAKSWIEVDIEKLIYAHNKKMEEEFKNEIDEKVKIFRTSKEFLEREHKEEWEEDTPNYPPFPLWGGGKSLYKKKRVHYDFYIIEGGPDVIDMAFVPQYIEFVKKISDNYIRIASSIIKLWDEKKIKSNASSIIQIIQPQNQIPLLNSSSSEPPSFKLKTNLTSGQILYLFKTLKSLDIFGKTSIIDLCRFIASNISTKGKEELSAENLAKVWSNIDPNDIAYWYETFPEMSKKVIKDNPNKIKYKDFDKK